MALAKQQTHHDLMAELNEDLRARDPMRIMKQQMRTKVLAEIRLRVKELRSRDTKQADTYLRLEEIISDLERPQPA